MLSKDNTDKFKLVNSVVQAKEEEHNSDDDEEEVKELKKMIKKY